MKTRFKMNQVFPEAYKLLYAIDAKLKQTGLSALHIEMIKIRASQINNCAFCLNMHIGDALKLGEDPKRIYVLSAWHEATDWFTIEEQTILRLTEEVTLISQKGVSDEVYEKAVELFGEEGTAHLMMAVISINSWNRLGVGLNLHPVA